MTSAFSLSAVFGNVLVLLVLAVAAAGPRLSPLGRLMFSSLAFISAWLMNAAFDTEPAPDWMLIMGGAVTVVSVVVVIALLHRWTQAAEVGETQPARRGDEGGGGPRRHLPDAPKPGGGDSDPSWWPEFERQLSVYAAERDGARGRSAALAQTTSSPGGGAAEAAGARG